uniref:Uncharacterized protein n=1 Tax=Ascaris lumbricoides TaxID=6252 RepID=A0A0M3HTL0_ASCLU
MRRTTLSEKVDKLLHDKPFENPSTSCPQHISTLRSLLFLMNPLIHGDRYPIGRKNKRRTTLSEKVDKLLHDKPFEDPSTSCPQHISTLRSLHILKTSKARSSLLRTVYRLDTSRPLENISENSPFALPAIRIILLILA